ncbi:DeoR/GlpR family DNA-binding transcription regulator [Paenibacillus ihbetae]|uniref:DeoR family transcriptional regulator n=1 Tax=Paenibacillus ihbetae TaxID=1870820 RepID=A0ABX3K3H2_9BACL|nr:DeoR/GlpR family DNA-binding transcription regulator [Paenibacillus ihbetae]OOC63969.1 DeoR family transcriptional regulator [Paenibacillus ihbetae]
MSVTFEDRRQKILHQLELEGKVKVHALAMQLDVSAETVRRDLDRLEKEGRLRKVYGGAVKSRSGQIEPSFLSRSQTHTEEKAAIGKLAASLVKDGETILLDNGTTTIEVMRYLQDRAHVTVITHSVPILNLAMEIFQGKIIFIGGNMDRTKQAATGPLTEMLLEQFKVNKAFISVGGISLTDGITDYDLDEAYISRKMLERAEEGIVLADHSKLGVTTFSKLAGLEDISMIITDPGCPQEWVDNLAARGIEVLTGPI